MKKRTFLLALVLTALVFVGYAVAAGGDASDIPCATTKLAEQFGVKLVRSARAEDGPAAYGALARSLIGYARAGLRMQKAARAPHIGIILHIYA